MTTLAKNMPRAFALGALMAFPAVAADIVFEGAAVGDNGSGYARPLVAGDRFLGFSEGKVDNSAGSAGDVNVRVMSEGIVRLSVSGAVATDVGQPVYASDDDTFTFNPVGNSFVGMVTRFVSSGVVEVSFGITMADPYGEGVRELVSADKTLDAEDTGKTFFVDTDTVVVTLPATATAGLGVKIVNLGAFGTVGLSVSPNASDKIHGPDLAGTNDKDLINTKATARRGDFAVLSSGHADGWVVSELSGTWAEEA